MGRAWVTKLELWSQGIPNAANNREDVLGDGYMVDNKGTFLEFGDTAMTVRAGRILKRSWSYDVTTNEWTWVSGKQHSWFAGKLRYSSVPSLSNVPPANVKLQRVD